MKFAKNWRSNFATIPRAFVLAVFVSGLLISGAGCEVPLEWELPSASSTAGGGGVPLVSDWEEVEPGVERFNARVATSDVAARLVMWRFSPESDWTWALATTTEPRPVSAWVDEGATPALFAVNAGYFHEDGSPSGWVSLDGVRWGKRFFDPEKSGIVTLGAKPTILLGTAPTSTIKTDAFQSYPFLIKSGERAFTQETGQYARRTFVAIDAEQRWYVGVVPSEPVTLFQLATLLKTLPIRWTRALNLDGGPSTGLVTSVAGREDRFDSFAPVAYVIVALRRL